MNRDCYTVLGNPIAHSLSPAIHRYFAEQTGELITYTSTHVPLGALGAVIREFQATGGKGANVTVPFKREAMIYVSDISERAQLAGCVNTLSLSDDGRIGGDNTDGVGFVTDFVSNCGGQLHKQKILIIGAGGAAQGILPAIMHERPLHVCIINRNHARAIQLAEQYRPLGSIDALAIAEMRDHIFDVIIHATAAGLESKTVRMPEGFAINNANCYDLSYGPAAQPFLQWAKSQGAHNVHDGFGMLVEQAAESFFIWRNKRPDTQELIRNPSIVAE